MFNSPLRYPGGKNKLAPFIAKICVDNKINKHYVEPYAGGASVALYLLFEDYIEEITINDLDRSIFAFWHSVLNNTKKLCDLIEKTELTIENRLIQKEIQRNKQRAKLLELGFSTFFLNRTNRSGIIKAGVIGGNNQEGNYKINSRYNKNELIERIKKIASYKNRISLYNLDALELIKTISKELPTKTLIYFDPPYFIKGKELYANHYKYEDHLLVSKMINKIKKHKWLVSYDNTKEIKELYFNNEKISYSLSYSAINSSKGKEVMFYHKDLNIPKFNAINCKVIVRK